MAITKVGDVSEERRGRGRPQVRPDEETRAVILDVARQQFATSGYAATSMESVARRAGVSTKTLYRLIPNKGALFEAIITDGIDRFVSRIRLRPCENEDIECALRDALIACGELILDGAVIGLLRMVIGEGDNFPEITETFYNKAIKRTESTLASWLKAQAERRLIAIDNPTEAAGMLLGMLAFQPQRAVMLGQAPPPGREELERRAHKAAALFLRGCAS
ncbi:TetR/AcrR family transcriptional regulator [Bradyrhizobium sp. CB1015]|uniref:TetR/AcrR family transcriptional regulator n=1 Tax=Bradyrhizobium sp. CB1015 TaxID=2976822 RepID=UPI0021AA7FEA|nr:TetR/AcrR family transcriptional regulator [Bradyrhizobium sp. CB1015]UWU94177.1 TetR/AcrR family transcriptional regulator [Bradyrhizobium sp. CB1015]